MIPNSYILLDWKPNTLLSGNFEINASPFLRDLAFVDDISLRWRELEDLVLFWSSSWHVKAKVVG